MASKQYFQICALGFYSLNFNQLGAFIDRWIIECDTELHIVLIGKLMSKILRNTLMTWILLKNMIKNTLKYKSQDIVKNNPNKI